MKRWVCCAAGAFAAALTISTGLRAEEPEGGPPPRERMERRMGRGQDPLRKELRFANQLREAVWRELELTEEQKAELGPIFQAHNDSLQEAARGPREGAPDRETQEQLAELERQAEAARESGDREEARRIRQEMMELRRGGQQRRAEELQQKSEELIESVRGQLTEEQLPRFEEILTRVRSQSEDGEPIMRLMMAGRRATARMELDDEQRRQVNEVLRNSVRDSMREGGQGQDHEAVMESVRTGILAALGPESGEEFMRLLHEEQQSISMRGPGRPGPGGRPEPTPDEPEEAPADPDGGE